MGAYAASVASPMRRPIRIGPNLICWRGVVTISNYNSTLAEITGITGKFLDPTVVTVLLGGASASGYLAAWIAASKAIKCWYPSVVRTHNHDITVIGGQAEGTTDILHSKNADPGLYKEEATNLTIAKADVATKGGVVSETLAASAGSEVANDVNVGAIPFAAFGLG